MWCLNIRSLLAGSRHALNLVGVDPAAERHFDLDPVVGQPGDNHLGALATEQLSASCSALIDQRPHPGHIESPFFAYLHRIKTTHKRFVAQQDGHRQVEERGRLSRSYECGEQTDLPGAVRMTAIDTLLCILSTTCKHIHV